MKARAVTDTRRIGSDRDPAGVSHDPFEPVRQCRHRICSCVGIDRSESGCQKHLRAPNELEYVSVAAAQRRERNARADCAAGSRVGGRRVSIDEAVARQLLGQRMPQSAEHAARRAERDRCRCRHR